jgi:hypothetical protein
MASDQLKHMPVSHTESFALLASASVELVFRLIHLRPALTMARASWART